MAGGTTMVCSEAAVGGEEGAEGGERHLELVGAHLEGEVGTLEDLEHRGELLVGWVECGARFDADSPSGPPAITVG
ncbi:MAG: hypothetical protein ACK58T_28215 [Phycisphaerae bacterium]